MMNKFILLLIAITVVGNAMMFSSSLYLHKEWTKYLRIACLINMVTAIVEMMFIDNCVVCSICCIIMLIVSIAINVIIYKGKKNELL